MTFDYEAAKQRINGELSDFVDKYWNKLSADYRKRKEAMVSDETDEKMLEDKISGLHSHSDVLGDDRKKFCMLYEFTHNCFWHATDNFQDLKKILPTEDMQFYATFAIEMAERTQGKQSYAWIVEECDNGNLKEFVSEELLKEAVNKGFWEIANSCFTSKNNVPERYTILMKYSHLLDLSTAHEFKTKPLTCEGGWIDEHYIEAFERAKQKLSAEDAAWLARPLIEQIINYVLSWESPKPNPKKQLESRLKGYGEYLGTNIIQKLFKEELSDSINCLDGDDASFYLGRAEILKPYLNISESEFTELVSSALPKSYNIGKDLVDADFPRDWLTKKALSSVQKNIFEYLRSPAEHPLRYDSPNELIPHLGFLQRCMKDGWLDEEFGKNQIKTGLENYLERKPRPGGKEVAFMLAVLNPEFVETRLYRTVVHLGISDLVKRNKIEEASEWYLKAKREGWLNKKKVPEFKLKSEKIPEDKLERVHRRTGKRIIPHMRELNPETTLEDFKDAT